MFQRSVIYVAAAMFVALVPFGGAQEPAQPTQQQLLAKFQSAMEQQDWPKAIETGRELVKMDDKNGQVWASLGIALHSSQKYDEALEAHKRAAEFPRSASVGAYNAACVYSIKNDVDSAVKWMGTAIEKGFRDAALFSTDPDMKNLRADPRYKDLAEGVKGRSPRAEGQAPAPPQPSARVFSSTSDRKCSRLFYWSGQSSPGQVVIDYGPIPWKDNYGSLVESGKLDDQRWRLGRDFWTNLDTNLTLSFGSVKVEPGQYYVTLEHEASDGYTLALLTPADVRRQKLDAFQAASTEGGLEIPMTHTKVDEVAQTLSISLISDPSDVAKAELVVRFGPHKLVTPFDVHLD